MSFRGKSKPTRPKNKKVSPKHDHNDQTFPDRKAASTSPSDLSPASFRFQNRKTAARQQSTPSLEIDPELDYLAGPEQTHNAEIVYFWDNYHYLKVRQGKMIEVVPSLWQFGSEANCRDYYKKRATLVDTMASICDEFGQHRTLYMAVFLFDIAMGQEFQNYLNDKLIDQAGATSLFMASKYCETEPFDINDLIELIDPSIVGRGPPKINAQDILQLQPQLLKRTHFLLNYDCETQFLNMYAIYLKMTKVDYFSCLYLLQVGLLHGRLNRQPPSLKAIAAIYLNNYLRYMMSDRSYPKQLKKIVSYTPKQVRSAAEKYMKALMMRRQYGLYGSTDKFGCEEFASITQKACPF